MKTLEEFLSSYYKNKRINEETENEETESTAENEIKQEKEKPDKEISSKYFFKNILFFTNERDSAKNKTLKNLEEAVKDTDIILLLLLLKK